MNKLTIIILICLSLIACIGQTNNKQVFKSLNILNKYKDSVNDFGIVALIACGLSFFND